jgi:antitoxin (DNA-binding transcriptional repressor) of toxin-antitoxin stability system
MRFVPVREFRNNSASVLRRLRQEGSLIVTSNGKPVALVRNLNEDNLVREIAALERDNFLAALGDLQNEAATKGNKPSEAEIQAEVRAVRRRRAA